MKKRNVSKYSHNGSRGSKLTEEEQRQLEYQKMRDLLVNRELNLAKAMEHMGRLYHFIMEDVLDELDKIPKTKKLVDNIAMLLEFEQAKLVQSENGAIKLCHDIDRYFRLIFSSLQKTKLKLKSLEKIKEDGD